MRDMSRGDIIIMMLAEKCHPSKQQVKISGEVILPVHSILKVEFVNIRISVARARVE